MGELVVALLMQHRFECSEGFDSSKGDMLDKWMAQRMYGRDHLNKFSVAVLRLLLCRPFASPASSQLASIQDVSVLIRDELRLQEEPEGMSAPALSPPILALSPDARRVLLVVRGPPSLRAPYRKFRTFVLELPPGGLHEPNAKLPLAPPLEIQVQYGVQRAMWAQDSNLVVISTRGRRSASSSSDAGAIDERVLMLDVRAEHLAHSETKSESGAPGGRTFDDRKHSMETAGRAMHVRWLEAQSYVLAVATKQIPGPTPDADPVTAPGLVFYRVDASPELLDARTLVCLKCRSEPSQQQSPSTPQQSTSNIVMREELYCEDVAYDFLEDQYRVAGILTCQRRGGLPEKLHHVLFFASSPLLQSTSTPRPAGPLAALLTGSTKLPTSAQPLRELLRVASKEQQLSLEALGVEVVDRAPLHPTLPLLVFVSEPPHRPGTQTHNQTPGAVRVLCVLTFEGALSKRRSVAIERALDIGDDALASELLAEEDRMQWHSPLSLLALAQREIYAEPGGLERRLEQESTRARVATLLSGTGCLRYNSLTFGPHILRSPDYLS